MSAGEGEHREQQQNTTSQERRNTEGRRSPALASGWLGVLGVLGVPMTQALSTLKKNETHRPCPHHRHNAPRQRAGIEREGAGAGRAYSMCPLCPLCQFKGPCLPSLCPLLLTSVPSAKYEDSDFHLPTTGPRERPK